MVNEFGADTVKNYIDRVGSYIKSKHVHYDSHEATIRKWILEDREKAASRKADKHTAKPNRFHNFTPSGEDYDAVVRELNGLNGLADLINQEESSWEKN